MAQVAADLARAGASAARVSAPHIGAPGQWLAATDPRLLARDRYPRVLLCAGCVPSVTVTSTLRDPRVAITFTWSPGW
jgi:hypothetical protein